MGFKRQPRRNNGVLVTVAVTGGHTDVDRVKRACLNAAADAAGDRRRVLVIGGAMDDDGPESRMVIPAPAPGGGA